MTHHEEMSAAWRPLRIPRPPSLALPELALVVAVSDEAHNFMTALQVEILQRHGLNDALIAPPHITLKLGFERPELAAFADYLDEVAKSTPPFEIVMRGIGCFPDGVVFIGVEPNPPLDQLRRRVVRELAERFQVEPLPHEGDQFRFHATVAYALSKIAVEEEMARLSRLSPSFRFEARALAMLCHTGEYSFTYRRASLL